VALGSRGRERGAFTPGRSTGWVEAARCRGSTSGPGARGAATRDVRNKSPSDAKRRRVKGAHSEYRKIDAVGCARFLGPDAHLPSEGPQRSVGTAGSIADLCRDYARLRSEPGRARSRCGCAHRREADLGYATADGPRAGQNPDGTRRVPSRSSETGRCRAHANAESPVSSARDAEAIRKTGRTRFILHYVIARLRSVSAPAASRRQACLDSRRMARGETRVSIPDTIPHREAGRWALRVGTRQRGCHRDRRMSRRDPGQQRRRREGQTPLQPGRPTGTLDGRETAGRRPRGDGQRWVGKPIVATVSLTSLSAIRDPEPRLLPARVAAAHADELVRAGSSPPGRCPCRGTRRPPPGPRPPPDILEAFEGLGTSVNLERDGIDLWRGSTPQSRPGAPLWKRVVRPENASDLDPRDQTRVRAPACASGVPRCRRVGSRTAGHATGFPTQGSARGVPRAGPCDARLLRRAHGLRSESERGLSETATPASGPHGSRPPPSSPHALRGRFMRGGDEPQMFGSATASKSASAGPLLET
jgi:hypothetical protein